MEKITKEEARLLLLEYHCLLRPRSLKTDDDIVNLIERLGCIQYDPLDRCGRNADLVLQSRTAGYRPERLYDLLYEKRRLVDGWDKNMSVWAASDWPYMARRRAAFGRRYEGTRRELSDLRRQVLSYLETNPCISSSDIDDRRKIDWSWAPANVVRAVLESMYHSGELLIHHREGTRKYYAGTGKLLPPSLFGAPEPNPGDDDYDDWQLLRRIGAVGMLQNRSSDALLGTGLKKEGREAALGRLRDQGLIEAFIIEGIDDFFYKSTSVFPYSAAYPATPGASFLAPLDNLIWDRKLVEDIFGFEYRWEVYTPKAERRYGYYVLPVICGSGFAGRIEPVFDKKTKTLKIEGWWPEKSFSPAPEDAQAMGLCLSDFAAFLGAEKVETGDYTFTGGLRSFHGRAFSS